MFAAHTILRSFWKLCQIFLIQILACGILFAGNIKMGKIAFPVNEISMNDLKPITVSVENTNSTYPVTGIEWKWKIFTTPDGALLYEDSKGGTDINALEKKDVELKGLDWDQLQLGKTYRIMITFDADYDELPIDNVTMSNFNVISGGLNRTQASEIAKNWFETKYPLTGFSNAALYLSENTYPAGTEIKFGTYSGQSELLGSTSFIGVANGNIEQIDPVALEWFSVNATNGEIKSYTTDWFPKIGNVAFPNTAEEEKSTFLYGKERIAIAANELEYLFDASNEPNESSPCILIVTGKPQNDREANSFSNLSISLFRQEFQKERWGQRIPDGSYETLINPTAVDLMDKIESMKNRCKKFIFYYIGHGDSLNGMVLNDETMPYKNLYQVVFEKDFERNFFVFDCCFSGLALEELDKSTNSANRNVTVLTSCGRNIRSNFRLIELTRKDGSKIETGLPSFSNSLFTSLGKKEIDINDDLETSLKEAFDDARLKNPLVTVSEHLNDFEPGIITRNYQEVSSSKISFPDNDVEFDFETGVGDGHVISVSCDRGKDLFIKPLSPKIIKAVRDRLFRIDVSGSNKEFNTDVRFRMSDAWDDLSGSEGEIGVIYREDDNDEWKPFYPFAFSQTNRTVEVKTNTFSQWAFARVEPQTSVPEVNDPYEIVIYPETLFNDNISVSFKLEAPAHVQAKLYNLQATEVLNAVNTNLPGGKNTIGINQSGLSPGVYILNLTINGIPNVKKILIY